jgi:hypothetical protein
MAKATVQTNLLGRRAKLTFGLTDEQIVDRKSPDNCRSLELMPRPWTQLGCEGEIVLVTTKESDPYIAIRKDDGNLVESWLSHFRVL